VAGDNGGSFTLAADGSYSFDPGSDFDYLAAGETTTSRVSYTVSDNNGATSSTDLTITITGTNDAPTNIALSTNAVDENTPIGTVVGTLTASDVDAGGTFTYTLVAGNGTNDADNGLVSIFGNELRVNGSIDFETNPDLAINIQVTDAGGLSHTEALNVTVNDIDEISPTINNITLSDYALKVGDTPTVTLTFSEKVNNDFSVTANNGTFGTFSSSDGGTTWTAVFTPDPDIESGTNAVIIVDGYTDLAGNPGTGATSGNYTIDTAAPDVAISAITDDSAGASATDFITSDNTLSISGSYQSADTNGSNDLTVTFNGTTYTLGTDAQLTSTGGNWQLDLNGATLADNSYTVVATATDTAGNSNSASQVIKIDIAAPNVTITGITDDSAGTSNADFITNDNTLIINGSFDSVDNAVLTVKLDGTTYTVGDGYLSTASNIWTLNVESIALGEGNHSVVATSTDAAGNTNSAARTIVIDTVQPGTPTISESADDVDPVQGNVANNGYTNDTTLTLSGTAEKDSKVTIYDGALLIATIWADGAGNWSHNLTALSDGSTYNYKITATDAAGNISADSSIYTLHIDTSVAAPTIELTTDIGDNTTGTFTVTGVEAGASVEYSATGLDGSWVSTAPAFSENSDNTVYVRQTDLAGNSASSLLTFTYGSAADNTINGDENNNILVGGTGNDILDGAGGDDTLYGDGGNDTLTGGAGTNTLYGGDGNDSLVGGAGNNTMHGGSGSDTASYAGVGSGTVITASLATGSGGDGTFTDTYDGIENLTGGAGNDHLTGDDNANILAGGDGDDVFYGTLGSDTIYGNTDTVPGTDIDTVSYASFSSAINASLTVGTGGDGSFTDTYSGIENLVGGSSADTLAGDGMANILTGGDGNDSLNGMAGNDTLYGGVGADTLDGGADDDLLIGGAGGDTLIGGLGNDTASYANAGARVYASLLDPDFRAGEAFGDTYNGIENLIGSAFGDRLEGDHSDNILTGGGGRDFLDGYGGNDTFNVSSDSADLPYSLNGGAGTDTVVLQNLVGTYDLTALANVTTSIEALNINDGVGTEITVTSADIQRMVGNDNASELTILANNGDSLVLGSGSIDPTPFVADVTADYTITDGTQTAVIHWVVS
ncbi:MAG: Ig-like domain-containing protein, partial [Desulfuromonadales bacterium]|nr:Ig-like domain-containing protein [Desulfuromonadales bacterium]